MKRVVCYLFFFLALISNLTGCSEDTKAPVVDETGPEVELYVPRSIEPATTTIADSVDVYVGARDVGAGGAAGSVTSVDLYFKPPAPGETVHIGSVGTPISIESVPDSATRETIRQQLPAGWNLYTRRWYTGPTPLPPIGTPIRSGTYVQIFAVATDLAGNQGRTADPVRVVIFNEGENLKPPIACFTLSPPTAEVGTEFVFDPTCTSDEIDTGDAQHNIRVRWDFDGNANNGWDLDWSADRRADEVIRRVFDRQGIYTIRMEAHNSYLVDSIDVAEDRTIRVTPAGGAPDPPDPDENYVDIPSGVYPISKPDSSFVLDNIARPVDFSERPFHYAEIKNSYRICKYEVSNFWYLQYLEAELAADDPEIQFLSQAIWSRDETGAAPVLYCELSQSRIYYSLDEERFLIAPGFEDHPVTGVTWDGANAYALAYGLRLPSEAEWEVAARGMEGDLDYPFPGGVNLQRSEGRFRVNFLDARETSDPFRNGTTPVGFYDGRLYAGFQTVDTRSSFGCFDMAGNVAEWVNDWFDSYNYDRVLEYGEIVPDPQGPNLGIFKVARGGSYIGTRVDCRATARRGYEPEEYGTSIGFRCAFNPLGK